MSKGLVLLSAIASFVSTIAAINAGRFIEWSIAAQQAGEPTFMYSAAAVGLTLVALIGPAVTISLIDDA